jgi:hypothetical protein
MISLKRHGKFPVIFPVFLTGEECRFLFSASTRNENVSGFQPDLAPPQVNIVCSNKNQNPDNDHAMQSAEKACRELEFLRDWCAQWAKNKQATTDDRTLASSKMQSRGQMRSPIGRYFILFTSDQGYPDECD